MKPEKSPKVLWKKYRNGNILVFDMDTGVLLTLDPVAGVIFELCDGSHSSTQICKILRKSYSDPPSHEAILQEVHAALREFESKGIVHS